MTYIYYNIKKIFAAVSIYLFCDDKDIHYKYINTYSLIEEAAFLK
jgi:hypothetical protein